MPRIIGSAQTFNPAAAATSVVVNLPAHQSGDLLAVFAMQADGSGSNTFSVSGSWTIQKQQAASGSVGRHAWMYLKASSSSETLTITSGVSALWAVSAMCIRGIHATTYIDTLDTAGADIHYVTDDGSSGAIGLPTPAPTTATNNSLVLYGMVNDPQFYWQNHTVPIPKAGFHVVDFVGAKAQQDKNSTLMTGYMYKRTAGSVTGPTFLRGSTTGNSLNFGSIVMIVRDDGNANHPGYQDSAVTEISMVDPIHSQDPAYGGSWVSGTTYTSGNVAGVANGDATNSTSNNWVNTGYFPPLGSSRITTASANRLSKCRDLTTNTIGGAPVARDFSTGGFLIGSCSHEIPADSLSMGTAANAGLFIGIYDTNGTPRWRVWSVGGSDLPGHFKGNTIYFVNPANTASQLDASGTAPTLSATKGLIVGHSKTANTFGTWAIDHHGFYYVNKVAMVGGGSGAPANFTSLKQTISASLAPASINLGNSGVLLFSPLVFGGSESSYISINGASIEFPTALSTSAPTTSQYGAVFAANDLGVNINISGSDTLKLNNVTITSGTKFYFTMASGVAGTVDFTGLIVRNAGTLTLRPVGSQYISSATFDQCDTATLNAVKLDGCTFSNATSSPAMTVTSTTEAANMKNLVFTNNTNGHSVTITATGTYTFDHWTFTGGGAATTTTADVYNNSGGAVTINVTNGGSTPTIRNGTSASTTVNNSVTVTVTVVDAAGSPIVGARVYVKTAAGVRLNDVTDGSGIATASFNYTSSEAITQGWVRRATSGTLYRETPLAGTITSSGYTATAIMQVDQ